MPTNGWGVVGLFRHVGQSRQGRKLKLGTGGKSLSEPQRFQEHNPTSSLTLFLPYLTSSSPELYFSCYSGLPYGRQLTTFDLVATWSMNPSRQHLCKLQPSKVAIDAVANDFVCSTRARLAEYEKVEIYAGGRAFLDKICILRFSFWAPCPC